MSERLIALVDCNSFYVSCECVFRPDLWDKPVGVLSNNDGCFIARSQALKALGIKTGMPLFQAADLVKKHNVHLFSANFALYGDMSCRVMSLLETFSPNTEIYSIDEAFLDLTGICRQDPIGYALDIKQSIRKNTGIPVCVGMGPTKTLAKLANFAAKKWPKTNGVVDLSCPQRRERLMRLLPVDNVWGIGSRLSRQLSQLGIHTAWALAQQPVQRMQVQFSVVLARTIMELNGISCLELAEIAADKQEIMCSRSFKRPLDNLKELSEALAEFCSRAAEKLRARHSTAERLTVFYQNQLFSSPRSAISACRHPEISHGYVGYTPDNRYGNAIIAEYLQRGPPLPQMRHPIKRPSPQQRARPDGFIRQPAVIQGAGVNGLRR